MRNRWLLGVPIFLLLAGSILLFEVAPYASHATSSRTQRTIRVLAYSSFISSWGPGAWIADEFEKRHGVHVDYQDGGDAGLLLAKLKLFPSDVVVGFDQLSLNEARAQEKWQPVGDSKTITIGRETDFVPFDWAPLSFVYRKQDGLRIPQTLDDLKGLRFSKSLSLEDPRTSAPGLVFLYWILDIKGTEGGFEFLRQLKANIARVSPSWATAYGFFTKHQAAFAFSYFTSPVYHELNENDSGYSAVAFDEGQPVEIEYAGSPASSTNSDDAKAFLDFLLEPDVQKKIMMVNAMLPVVAGVADGTSFAKLPPFKIRDLRNIKDLQSKRAELFQRWQDLGL